MDSSRLNSEARQLGHGSFFGALPTRGIWTPLGLGRAQFVAILALSIALFIFVDGPVWRHPHDSHFLRIGLSYAAIPLAVLVALWRNRDLRATTFLGASAVLALIKLVATALLLMLIGIAG